MMSYPHAGTLGYMQIATKSNAEQVKGTISSWYMTGINSNYIKIKIALKQRYFNDWGH